MFKAASLFRLFQDEKSNHDGYDGSYDAHYTYRTTVKNNNCCLIGGSHFEYGGYEERYVQTLNSYYSYYQLWYMHAMNQGSLMGGNIGMTKKSIGL